MDCGWNYPRWRSEICVSCDSWRSFLVNQGATFLNVSDASWGYSFLYNGAYCIPNIVICTVLMVLVARFYPQFLAPNTKIGEEDSLKEGEKEEVTDEQANQE